MLDCLFVCLFACLPVCLFVFLVYMFRLLLFVFGCIRVFVGFVSVGSCVCSVSLACMFARLFCLLCLFCLLVLACVVAWLACVAFVAWFACLCLFVFPV